MALANKKHEPLTMHWQKTGQDQQTSTVPISFGLGLDLSD